MRIKKNARRRRRMMNVLRSFPPEGLGENRPEYVSPALRDAQIDAMIMRLFYPEVNISMTEEFRQEDAPTLREALPEALLEKHPEALTEEERETLLSFLPTRGLIPWLARVVGGYTVETMDLAASVERFANKAARLLLNLPSYFADSDTAQSIAKRVEAAGYLLAELLSQTIALYCCRFDTELDCEGLIESLQSIVMQRQFVYQMEYAGGRVSNLDSLGDAETLVCGGDRGRPAILATNKQHGWIGYQDVRELALHLRQVETSLSGERAALYEHAKQAAGNPTMRKLRHIRFMASPQGNAPDLSLAQELGYLYGRNLQLADRMSAENPFRETMYHLTYNRALFCYREDIYLLARECGEMKLSEPLSRRFKDSYAAAIHDAVAEVCGRYRDNSEEMGQLSQ